MILKTKYIRLTPNVYFRVLIARVYRKRWWLYTALMVLAVLLSFIKFDTFAIFVLIFAFLYPFLILLILWRHANSRDNRIAFLERYYTFEEDRIVAHLEDGMENPFKHDYFVKAEKYKTHYLLYISKSQFLYFPFEGFSSDEDLKYFEEFISTLLTR